MNIEEEFLSEVETKIKTKPKARKKSINSKRKGSAAELELAHILNERFQGYTFARSVQSGAYTGGFNQSRAEALTEEQRLVFSGDIRVPKNFKFTIEHKAYAEFDFWWLFNLKSELYNWYEQSATDARNVGKIPMLVVKINNHKRIAFIPTDVLPEPGDGVPMPIFFHNGRACYWFDDLLKLPDEYFFNVDKT